jgi:SNF2 family DNA or RNA helicase
VVSTGGIVIDLDLVGNQIYIRFPYDLSTVDRVKSITSDYRKRERAWLASATRLEEIYAVFPEAKASDKLIDWLTLQRAIQSIKTDGVSSPLSWAPANLLPHQKSALSFLVAFKRCALLDPPGSGKSRVAAAWASQALPALIVCPAAVKFHWRREIIAFCPKAEPVIVQGVPKAFQGSDLSKILSAEWVIINYDILKDWLPLLPPTFKTLVADEAHYCKEAKTRRGEAIQQAAKHVENLMFVTGSPALNRPAELESMLVALGYLSPRERFPWRVRFCDGQRVCINEKGVKYHGKPAEFRWSFSGASNVELLARELDTFSVRRPFSEIMSSLPPVTHTLMEVDIKDLREHEKMRVQMEKQLKSGDPHARGEALGILGKMISWCAAQKSDIIRDLVIERLDQGESPVVFCDFLEPLDTLRAALLGRSMSLDGRMSQEFREAVIKGFTSSREPKALLASRRACGTGLDGLQMKSRSVLYMNLCWTPEGHRQSWVRVAREGQTKPVEVITTIARGTIEEAVLRIVYEKAKVTDMLCACPSLNDDQKADWEKVLGLIGGL